MKEDTNRAQCLEANGREDSGKMESGLSEDKDRSSKLKKSMRFGNFVISNVCQDAFNTLMVAEFHVGLKSILN